MATKRGCELIHVLCGECMVYRDSCHELKELVCGVWQRRGVRGLLQLLFVPGSGLG